MADMLPKCVVEEIERLFRIGLVQCIHFLEKIWMRADRALSENDQVAREDVRALDRDPDRHRAIETAHVIVRAVDDRLAAVDIHGVGYRSAHAFGRVQFHNSGNDRRMMALIEAGAGKAARTVDKISVAGETAERLLDPFEFSDRNAELLA